MANRYERLVEQLDEKGRRPLRTTRGFYRSWDYDDREKFHRGKVRESYIIGDHRMRQTAVDLYSAAAAFALERGVIIADTKFEFGIGQNGEIIRVDEELTPDSSRFWPLEDYIPGKNPPSLDKQPVRDYGTSIGWNRLPPAPPLPRRVRNQTKARYREAARRLLAV